MFIVIVFVVVLVMLLMYYRSCFRSPRVLYSLKHTNSKDFVSGSSFLRNPYPFVAPPLLATGRVNTIAGAIRPVPYVHYVREYFTSPFDGGVVGLDVARATSGGNTPVLGAIVIHPGLASHSRSPYICTFTTEMTGRGWDVVVMNARGTGDTPLTTPQMFCAAWTRDIRDVAAMLRQRYVKEKGQLLVGVGFSLGANVMVKYIGEDGEYCVLDAGVSVCNPWDLEPSHEEFLSSMMNRVLFVPALTNGL
eukprot:PhF_6_TR35365/c0_g1_i7/m.51355